MKLILASASPRRSELLSAAGFNFEVITSDYEEVFDKSLSPQELVMKHAEGKAENVKEKILRFAQVDIEKNQNDQTLILGVDTIGFYQGQVLEKPRDRAHAKEMISLLSGTTHQVYSGLCLIKLTSNKKLVQCEKTNITFDTMTEDDIEWYLDQNEWTDKAAGYAIQGKGSRFVKSIEGDFFNVVGLPINRLKTMVDYLMSN